MFGLRLGLGYIDCIGTSGVIVIVTALAVLFQDISVTFLVCCQGNAHDGDYVRILDGCREGVVDGVDSADQRPEVCNGGVFFGGGGAVVRFEDGVDN